MGHPLLATEPLIELGRRLEQRRCIRTHGSQAAAGTPFNGAPDLHPNPRPAAETLRRIARARAFRERARAFHLEPGMGAYMPSTSPHMVESGDEPSLTASFTYYTDATRRDSLLHKANERLRAVGLRPPGVGKSRCLDTCLHAGFGTVAGLRERARRLAGRPPHSDRSPYACVGRH